MITYLDSSAIVKLVVVEAESSALRSFLRRRAGGSASSAIARLEVRRAVRLSGAAAVRNAEAVLSRLRLVRVDDAVLDAASALDPSVLRSLDALHVASALALGRDLDCLIAYDDRMKDAATRAGLKVRSPGS